jgi:hypothetical protein
VQNEQLSPSQSYSIALSPYRAALPLPTLVVLPQLGNDAADRQNIAFNGHI